jgi:hypothetical protein
MALYPCPDCGRRVSTQADACPHCGAPAADVVYVEPTREDPTLAVLSMVFYLLLYPVGLVLNIVGLFSGQKVGCHIALLAVFVGLPLLVVVALVALGLFAGALESLPG